MNSVRLRDLPAVDAVLNRPAAEILIERYGRGAATTLFGRRSRTRAPILQAGGRFVPGAEHIAAQAIACLEKEDRSALRPLFNLTGTVLHTNLGRAMLAEAAVERPSRLCGMPSCSNSTWKPANVASVTTTSDPYCAR